jgi:hypothetical protein
MRKYYKILIFFLLALFLCTGSAIALPFSSTGLVDSNYNNLWNSTTSSGTALFKFYIDENWPSVTEVTLEFENDIFDVGAINQSSFTVLNPDNWTTSIYSPTAGGYQFSISVAGDAATSANDPIQISFDYVLLSADRYNNASEGSDNGWEWDEGQAWGISYSLFAENGGYSFGSTNPTPTPEPATMILFGTGLIGIAVVGRKKLYNRS